MDKILKDRAYEVELNLPYDRYQSRLASMVYKFFDKKIGSGVISKSKLGSNVNEVLAQELQKRLIKKLNKGKSMRCLKIIFGEQI